jgi:hypothetical protein
MITVTTERILVLGHAAQMTYAAFAASLLINNDAVKTAALWLAAYALDGCCWLSVSNLCRRRHLRRHQPPECVYAPITLVAVTTLAAGTVMQRWQRHRGHDRGGDDE